MEELGLMMAEKSCEGDALQDVRMFRDAVERLNRTVQLDPDRVKARRKLVKMSMQMRRFQDAKQH